MRNSFYCIALLLFLGGCGDSKNLSHPYQEIAGRDQKPLYRIKTPVDWQRKDISLSTITDTTQPICEFSIDDAIRITIHNFPDSRIPPQAQIARWKQQFESVESSIIPQAFSGFVGLKFEGSGQEMAVLGWSLQLAPEFVPFCDAQTGADVTIKIVGPKDLIEEQKEVLEKFSRSFELIEPLSTNSIS